MFVFIPISIGALSGITERDAGVASGLLNTSQQLGGAIGVAVASSVAASHFETLVHRGYATSAALTFGFTWALWVCGLTGLVAVPVALLFVPCSGTAKAMSSDHEGRASVLLTRWLPWSSDEHAVRDAAGAEQLQSRTRVGLVPEISPPIGPSNN